MSRPEASADREHDLLATMRAEGLAPYRWDSDPNFVFGRHAHSYPKVLYCVRGSIRFVLAADTRSIELRPGDRLDLPPHTEHAAFVGPEGVACLEAQR